MATFGFKKSTYEISSQYHQHVSGWAGSRFAGCYWWMDRPRFVLLELLHYLPSARLPHLLHISLASIPSQREGPIGSRVYLIGAQKAKCIAPTWIRRMYFKCFHRVTTYQYHNFCVRIPVLNK